MLFFSVIKNKLYGSLLFLLSSIIVLLINNHFAISGYLIDRMAALSIPFSIGALLFSVESYWKDSNKVKLILMAASIAGIAMSPANDERSILFLMSVPVAVIILGSSVKDVIIKGRFDFSYGIYIYAFPVQQICSNIVSSNFYVSILISFFITFILAAMSLFMVERRFINRKASTSLSHVRT